MQAARWELLNVRWMIRRDMPEVLRIERAAFPDPWTLEDFMECLRDRTTIGLVAEWGELVVGYMLYRLHRRRIDILNLAVDPGRRRRGVGSQLIGRLVAKMPTGKWRFIAATVRERNLPAQLFLRACGFRACCVLHGAYDGVEDGYLMRCEPSAPLP